ncbi:MAG: DUF805 domain-containing protein [Candidatus Taylorbacteria bacterium]|nr:DUF805 domain-containing protein [Candidatus Taylorbacteria bacterium]
MNYFITCLKKYAVFEGRARRAEYWYFVLFSTLISIVIGLLESVDPVSQEFGTGTLGFAYNLLILLPSLAAGARRLHDINKSGWFLLIGIIPILGWILIIVWLARKGDAGPNDYGSDPKIEEATVLPPRETPTV